MVNENPKGQASTQPKRRRKLEIENRVDHTQPQRPSHNSRITKLGYELSSWYEPFDLDRVVIVGGGISGLATLEILSPVVNEIIVIEDSMTPDLERVLEESGCKILESNNLNKLEKAISGSSLIVMSPGVPRQHPTYQLAKKHGISITTEIELGYTRLSNSTRLVAVTGTNGKTTVTKLLVDALKRLSVDCIEAGNIGLPLISIPQEAFQVVVCEVSSFQLSLIDRFKPDIAIWLNLQEDHLDYHGSFEDYAQSKSRIFKNLDSTSSAIVNNSFQKILDFANDTEAKVVTFGTPDAQFSVRDGTLAQGSKVLAKVEELTRRFPHDLENDLAVLACVDALGIDPVLAVDTIKEFSGLSHRIELAGIVGEISFYDDSKATTPASVVAALGSFESVILILGGKDKDLDFSIIVPELSKVRQIIAIGQASNKIFEKFSKLVPVTIAQSMQEAVKSGYLAAQPGDAVVLSPGCASFDWYASYRQRGDDFRRSVQELMDNQ